MVDSMPTRQGPPSSTSRLVAEFGAHVLGGGRAHAAELVGAGRRPGPRSAASPRAQACSNACATGWAGQRRPIGCLAAGRRGGHVRRAAAGSTSAARARRPASAAARTRAPRRRTAATAAASATCTISGWSLGRPLAAKILATAASLHGIGAQAVDGLGRETRPARRRPAPATACAIAAAESAVEDHRRPAQNGVDAQHAARPAARWPAPPRPSAPVTVRWPILRPAARAELAVQVQVRCRARPAPGPTAACVSAVAAREPQVAQQVEHDRRAVLARLRQRQAGQRAHLQLELRHVAGVHAVVAAVVRPRRHFVDHQRAVLRARRTPRTARRRSAGLRRWTGSPRSPGARSPPAGSRR